jgi:hypothetical protein
MELPFQVENDSLAYRLMQRVMREGGEAIIGFFPVFDFRDNCE